MTGLIFPLFAQIDDATIREKVLEDLEKAREQRARELEDKIVVLDLEIQKIDEALKLTQNTDEIIEKLRDRVNKLEGIQTAEREKEINIYSSNYQSAVINLVSMERELRPLILFNSSRDFFSSLTSVGNPMQYPGYNEWFGGFKKYVEGNKREDASLQITSKLLETVGDFAQGAPIAGPLSDVLFIGMDKFIQSIGKKKRELRERSVMMFELTMILSQYTHDINLVETGWNTTTKELEELQRLQANTLVDIFQFLDIKNDDFREMYLEQTDALKRLDYLNSLKRTVEQKVRDEKGRNDEAWKNKMYYDMQTVQSLKIRFGNITFNMKENLDRYEKILQKYEGNELIGDRIKILKG
ncbi:MAG: hypothetical protein AAFR59_07730, partial [Bacteroidota bacterium]